MLSLSFYRRLDRWLSKLGVKPDEIDLDEATEAANNGDPEGLSDQMDTEQVIQAQHLSDDLIEKIRRTTKP